MIQQAVAQWEADRTFPTLPNLRRLADVFEVPIDALVPPADAFTTTTVSQPALTGGASRA